MTTARSPISGKTATLQFSKIRLYRPRLPFPKSNRIPNYGHVGIARQYPDTQIVDVEISRCSRRMSGVASLLDELRIGQDLNISVRRVAPEFGMTRDQLKIACHRILM